jgi:hypothetical protein
MTEPPAPPPPIAFPASAQAGHALKVARRLAKARSPREADSITLRVSRAFWERLLKSGVPRAEVNRQLDTFWQLIRAFSIEIGSRWVPALTEEHLNRMLPKVTVPVIVPDEVSALVDKARAAGRSDGEIGAALIAAGAKLTGQRLLDVNAMLAALRAERIRRELRA